MRLRERRRLEKPELVIIPMIDIMFFLLVFFMLGTMYMMEVKTVPVRLPSVQHAGTETKQPFSVTVKEDGTVWQGDAKTDLDALVGLARGQAEANPDFSVVIRADKNAEYGEVMQVMDRFRGAGIKKFGLAAETGAGGR